ncbi:HAD-IIIC family phosphatase [Lichenicoccus sp.]|uniref:HAD-IIIC family phosphatase n=1 Tax=Lichenicoccus sp. TaxID=2781899 RepID=UPI003D14A69D
MVEAVRLIVWDLDETFWQGTLTEGGIRYIDMHHDIVIALAHRGIMSSICSKNDLASVQRILKQKGIWDFFIFPSINWEPKGPRLKALVEAVQLRPATILFIDDNAMNRNEALHFLPEIQVASDTIIPTLLEAPLLAGKPGSGLERLGQYKVMESRREAQSASADNKAFLRASNIQVTVEHNVEAHLDRAIELINRTNQLNFTKRRLPEGLEEARKRLRSDLAKLDVNAGLIRVRDTYGDYGLVGLYVIFQDGSSKQLLHYCFSCRILGMGVEAWIFEQLGRPDVKVWGEVLTDLHASTGAVDWINESGSALSDSDDRLTGRILVRGGCDMQCIAHYLELNAEEVVGEFNIVRNKMAIRLDHLAFLQYAFEGLANEAVAEALRVGFVAGDFRSRLADDPTRFDVCVFSFWNTANQATYSHRRLQLSVPVALSWGDNTVDVRTHNRDVLEERATPPILLDAIEVLRGDYDFVGPSALAFSESLTLILAHIPQSVVLIFLLAPEKVPDRQGQHVEAWRFVAQNKAIAQVVAGRENVHLLRIEDFINHSNETTDGVHFSRMVYYRVYQRIASILRKGVHSSGCNQRPQRSAFAGL